MRQDMRMASSPNSIPSLSARIGLERAVCKCCGAAALPFGTVDFSKSCQDITGKVLPKSGEAVTYYRCPSCGFLFTTFLDSLTEEEIARRIYNADYIKVDPEFAERRPAGTAKLVETLFGRYAERLRVLDYGGGAGQLATLLRGRGFCHVVTYDPYHGHSRNRPDGVFDLVLAIEVIEHSTAPIRSLADMAACMAEGGIMLFTTHVQPKDIAACGLDWWYVAPRNGHVSIHSERSLRLLAAGQSLTLLSLNDVVHVCVARGTRRLQEPVAQVLRGRAWSILRHAARQGVYSYARAMGELGRRGIVAPVLRPQHAAVALCASLRNRAVALGFTPRDRRRRAPPRRDGRAHGRW